MKSQYNIKNGTPLDSQAKKAKIREIAQQLLSQSRDAMLKNIEKALNSGAIDIDAWDENRYPMILPKSIVIAVLLEESGQYDCRGTSFEKEIKATVKNLRHFI